MEQAERIDVAGIQETGHPFALFRKETAVRGIAHRIVDVDRFVADIVVAAENQLRA